MSMDAPEIRPEWKLDLIAFLLPQLRGSDAERTSTINTVIVALDTAHSEGLRQAASFCREIGRGSRRDEEIARVLAVGIERMTQQNDTASRR